MNDLQRYVGYRAELRQMEQERDDYWCDLKLPPRAFNNHYMHVRNQLAKLNQNRELSDLIGGIYR